MKLVFDNKALRKARENCGLTQMEVSRKSGIPQTTISSYERGESEPTVKVMRLLAIAYNLDPSEFIDVCFRESEVA